MSNLDSELVSATFTKLAGAGDIAGIKYYRDSLIGNNVLSDNEVRAVNIVASATVNAFSAVSAVPVYGSKTV
jgi:hypothetical protein